MKRVMRQAYTEVNEIIKYLPKEYVEKIPIEYRRLFNDASLEDYPVNIDPDKGILEQKLVYETLVILTILKLNYWCESEEEKEKIRKQLEENERANAIKYDISKLNEKNTPSEKTSNNDETMREKASSNLPAKAEKQSIISRIIARIKKFFKKVK